MDRRGWVVTGAVLAGLLGGAAVASDGGGSGLNCYEALWTGIRQYEDLNGKKCASYTDCPLAIKCYYGRVYQRYEAGSMQDVPCRGYTNGQWDTTKGRCVGGTLTTTSTTERVMVERCVDGCN